MGFLWSTQAKNFCLPVKDTGFKPDGCDRTDDSEDGITGKRRRLELLTISQPDKAQCEVLSLQTFEGTIGYEQIPGWVRWMPIA